MGTEQVYVRGRNANRLAVLRGVNGTEAQKHAAGAKIGIYQYPGPVSEAVIIQASRLWKRRYSTPVEARGFTGGFDPDAAELLTPYRRMVAL